MQDYSEKVLDGSRGWWITWLSSIRWCGCSRQEQVIFTTALLQAGKCPASIHIFTVRSVADEFWSTANNLFHCCHPFKKNTPNSKSRHCFSLGLLNLFRSTHTAQPQAVNSIHSLYPILHTLTKSQAVQMVEDVARLSWKAFSAKSQRKHSELKETKHSPPHIIHCEQKPQTLAVGPQGTGT